jgi:hypothetical protein
MAGGGFMFLETSQSFVTIPSLVVITISGHLAAGWVRHQLQPYPATVWKAQTLGTNVLHISIPLFDRQYAIQTKWHL